MSIPKLLFALILPYLQKIPIVFSFITSPKGLLFLPFLALPVLTTKQNIGLFLAALMLVDMATGIWVAWEKKKEHLETIKEPEEKQKLKDENLITSDKLKRSGVKLLIYSTTIFTAFWAEKVLLITPFTFSISSLQFSLSIIVMMCWIFVELYSIVIENAKELGFDVVKKLSKVIAIIKKGKNKIVEQ